MKYNSAAILFLIIYVSHLMQYGETGGCGPKFPITCECGKSPYDGIIQYVVNCTNTKLTNITVLEYMPKETQILIFTGNNIPELPWNILGNINDYNFLTVMDLSNNNIEEIRGKSFHHVKSVRRLILNHNNLSISRNFDYNDNNNDDDFNHHHPRVFSNFINLESLHLTNAFKENTSPQLSEDLHDIFVNSNLTKLIKLHLEQNEIKYFKDPKVFCDLPNLNDLYLGDNNLNQLNFNIKCLINLRFLDLQRNKFSYLKDSDLNLLNDLEELTTNGRSINLTVDFNLNPFECDCKIHSFHIWLQKTLVFVRNKDNLECFNKKLNQYEKITIAQYDECLKPILLIKKSNRSSHETILIFLLVTLSFTLCGLVSALIYMNRNKILPLVSPVLDNVSKKVHYTTIKDDESYPEVYV